MIPDGVKRYLEENGVEYEVLAHERTATAQSTAETAGVTGWKLAKCVAVRVDGMPVICAVPAPYQVDLDAVCDALGGSECELCAESELDDLFPGCEIGAAPPLGELFRMRTVCDRSLEGTTFLYFNGGNHRELISISWDDYRRLEEPEIADIGAMPGEAWKHAEELSPEPHPWHP